MQILYVSQYFPPEVNAPAIRVFELAKEWVRLDHDVTVLTGFAHHPTGVKSSEDQGVLTRRELVDGIDVLRTYVYATPNAGVLKRMLSYVSFMVSATLVGLCGLSRPHVVIATSPQLLCGVAGYFLARLMRVPFVFEVRDLWPETMIAVNVMKEGNPIVRGLSAVSQLLYDRASRIVTVGEGYSNSIHELHRITQSKMNVIHNGIDTEAFVPGPKDNEIRQEYGWSNKFVSMYLGTHGMCQGLEIILQVARQMKDDETKLFVFVGEGAEKEQLKQTAAEWQLRNVQFIDQQPRERVCKFYAACDLGIVCLRKSPRFLEVLPSKIFEFLGMERPIVLSARGEARKLLERAKGGVCVRPEDANAIAKAIRDLSQNRGQLERMGRNGREYVSHEFDRRKLAQKYLEILKSVRSD
jgi:colanic acid biosynthesis glycosyl transferase WcaI